MKLPGNCLLAALIAGAIGDAFCATRNRSGRLHFFWRNARGLAFEFYKPGASQRSYLQNALYFGEIRRAPALDA